MATLQYLPPSTSCWQPPAADTARTVSSLGTSPTRQSPTQLSPFDQSISSSYWRPLNLLLTLPHFLFSHLSDLPCLPRRLSLLIQPRLTGILTFSLVLPSLSSPPCQHSVLGNLSFATLGTLGAQVTLVECQIILLIGAITQSFSQPRLLWVLLGQALP